jgi:hypothetical protein
MGNCVDFSGNSDAARQLTTEGAAMYRALGAHSGLRRALHDLAETEFEAGHDLGTP